MRAAIVAVLLAATPERPAAPPLEGSAWINVSRPLTPADLRGRVVLLDFWTYGCLNCVHTIPAIEALEARFSGQPFAVVGVHSGKFDEEKDANAVRAAVRRLGIAHPVVSDPEYAIWDSFGARAWPTFVLIDKHGRAVEKGSGETYADALGPKVEALLAEAGPAPAGPLPLKPEPGAGGALRFPEGVAVEPDTGRIAVSDTGHHRIVVLDNKGAVELTLGGEAGFRDGREPRFRSPRGLDFAGGALYVADAGNHRLRKIDLATREVTTVAGSGEQGSPRDPGGPALAAALNSPWDVRVRAHTAYVAMAGAHRLWTVDLRRGTAAPFAGSGREELIDGPREVAALAQPMALDLDGQELYFADAESSAIRHVDLVTGRVSTDAGRGLFAFGDKDGTGPSVKLEHPQGLAVAQGAVFVADTYNHKLKRLDPVTGALTTIATGLNEPAAVAARGGELLVADTGNHRVVRVDAKTGAVSELRILGL